MAVLVRLFCVVGVVALGLSLAHPAAADIFATRGPEKPVEARIDVLVLEPQGALHAFIEQVTLINGEPQLVFLRAFPEPPAVSPAPKVFGALARAAIRRNDLANEVRVTPFGPSVLTLATRRLGWRHEPPPRVQPPPEARPLQVEEVATFSGLALTSTITGKLSLPAPLESFLDRRDSRLAELDRLKLAAYLNRGWSVLALALYDRAPNPEAPARIGPLRFEIAEGLRDYPLQTRERDDPAAFVFYAAGSEPLVPAELGARVAGPDDDLSSPPRGEVLVTFLEPLGSRPELSFQLSQELGLEVPEGAVLSQAVFRQGDVQLDRLTFDHPGRMAGSPPLPPPSRRGGRADLFRCLLLGLAPLLFAPESWMLLALQERWRSRARRGGTTLGVKAWAVWPFATALFWLIALDGLARIAALLPLVVGAAQLALPYAERETAPIRVAFRRPKKEGSARPRRPLESDVADVASGSVDRAG